MVILVKLIGIVIAAMGGVFLLNPKLCKQYATFWEQGRRLSLGGILAILIGVILLLAASEARLVGVITALGILSLLKGILILAFGQEKAKAMLKWWQGRPLSVLRLAALIVIAFGALLIYSL